MPHARWIGLFPGREAARKEMTSGICNANPRARACYEEASDHLRMDVMAVCLAGNIEPRWEMACLTAHCYAIFQAVVERNGLPDALAGYSQGELTACATSGAFSFTDTLDLILSLESVLMEEKKDNECMFRIIGVDVAKIEEICSGGANASVSAYLSRDQCVVSGTKAAVALLAQKAKRMGAKWAIDLHSETAFHNSLCGGVAQRAQRYFDATAARVPFVPVYSCLDGEKCMDGIEIRSKLSRQIENPIQWSKLIGNAYRSGIRKAVEIGPGCTASANTRIAQGDMECRWIEKMEDLSS